LRVKRRENLIHAWFVQHDHKREPERRGINPHTLEPIVIPAHSSIKFKAGRLLREQVLEPVKVKPAKKTTKTAKKK